MVIVETVESFENLKEILKSANECSAIAIACDRRALYQVNSLSVLVVFVNDETFVIPINHNDALSSSNIKIDELYCNQWKTFKSNEFSGLTNIHENVVDMALVMQNNGKVLDQFSYEPLYMKHMILKFPNIKNLNKAIPLLDLVEYSKRLVNDFESDTIDSTQNVFCQTKILPALKYVESSGIRIQRDKFDGYFQIRSKNSINSENIAYHAYNPYTFTGRPTAVAEGINYTALNHDEKRSAFISRYKNGKLLLVDFDSFHLRLIAEFINYQFGTGSIHTHFGKQYFNTDSLTDEQYKESKSKTFNLLYSDRVDIDAPDFFQQINRFKNDIWQEFLNNDRTYETKYGRIFRDTLDSPITKSKLFNYIIQNAEIGTCAQIILNIKDFLESKQTKLMLYIYDGMLFDIPESELDNIDELINVISMNGKYPVKSYIGNDYLNLTPIESEGNS